MLKLGSDRPGGAGALPLVALLGLVLSCGSPQETGGSIDEGKGVESSRPNVLLIVIDTLRADHLGVYGYGRDTSPHIQELLADRGVVVERAYAQAPWTLPSMASMMSGLDPARLLDDSNNPWGLPDAVTTLAEVLQARGYRSYGFVANPTLHQGNGFAQGFDTFETAPYDVASLRLHADHLYSKIEPRLGSLEEPFFLYTHFLDPHDPYENPEIPEGVSPFFPEYEGNLRGDDVHGLYLQKKQMDDPEQDVKHLRALYDSEIRYVDGFIGRLLNDMDPDMLRRTLVVLTSDHGEELYEHGGWKHGESVYEEQIRVPLIWRWDDRFKEGRRLDATVQLLDLMPTLLEATARTGDPPPPPGDGRSLLSALTGDAPLPAVAAYSRHHAEGPVRAARIDGYRKQILFDREALDSPETERGKTFFEQDRRRMERHEAYDLHRDPGELDARGEGHGAGVLERLDQTLGGIRLFVGARPGAQWEGEVRFSRPPVEIKRWFLAADDLVELQGPTLRFRLRGESIVKGLTVLGSVGEVAALTWSCSDPAASLVLGSDPSPFSLPVGLRRLLTNEWPISSPSEPRLHLWLRPPGPEFAGERDEETLRRLKALGYAD